MSNNKTNSKKTDGGVAESTMSKGQMEKKKLENMVKELFIKHNATTEDVSKVIDICKEYIQSTITEKINNLRPMDSFEPHEKE